METRRVVALVPRDPSVKSNTAGHIRCFKKGSSSAQERVTIRDNGFTGKMQVVAIWCSAVILRTLNRLLLLRVATRVVGIYPVRAVRRWHGRETLE